MLFSDPKIEMSDLKQKYYIIKSFLCDIKRPMEILCMNSVALTCSGI